MMPAGALFIFAFFGLVALFALKRWESRRERIIFPEVRRYADEGALGIKMFMLAALWYLRKLPYILFHVVRIGIHICAVTFGHLAHWIGEKSHALADLVSHKHRFERRETQSEFLKKVIEHPITNRSPGIAEIVHAASARPVVTEKVVTDVPEEVSIAPDPVLEVPAPKKKAVRKRRVLSRKKLENQLDNGQNS